jgi:hypothetical protein
MIAATGTTALVRPLATRGIADTPVVPSALAWVSAVARRR